jgi:hypothetical protein
MVPIYGVLFHLFHKKHIKMGCHIKRLKRKKYCKVTHYVIFKSCTARWPVKNRLKYARKIVSNLKHTISVQHNI